MYTQSVLGNGLRVVTGRLTSRQSAGLGIWVRVGGRFESKPRSGLSHFLEHMLFKGTRHRTTKQIKQDIEGVGGLFNAFTGEESTCYFVKIPRPHFAAAFDVLQDMINYATLETKEFEKERTVILEEIKMYLDLPSHYVQELMTELLWPDHPLGRSIAGTPRTVSGFKRAHLVEHVAAHYHPQNILVTACGDVDHQEAAGLAERYFASRNGKKPVSRFAPAADSKAKNAFRFVNKKTEQTHFVIGFHGLPRTHPDRYGLAVLNVILGANMSSRLFEEVREKRGLAYEIRSGLSFFEDAGAVTISAGVEPRKAPEAARVICRELERLKERAVPESELKRAKDYYVGQFLLGLEDTLDRMLWFGERVLYGDDIPDIENIRAHIEHVAPEDVRKLANRLFKKQALRLSLIGPVESKGEHDMKKACRL